MLLLLLLCCCVVFLLRPPHEAAGIKLSNTVHAESERKQATDQIDPRLAKAYAGASSRAAEKQRNREKEKPHAQLCVGFRTHTTHCTARAVFCSLGSFGSYSVRVCYKGYCQRIASQSHGEESVRQLILAARTQTNRHLSLSYTESTHAVSPHASHTLHPSSHPHTKVYLSYPALYLHTVRTIQKKE